jgi:hypothetical protein
VGLLVERCAGLDVGNHEVLACVRTPGTGGRRQEIRTFATFSAQLEALAAWLAELLEHGPLRGSLVPPPTIRQLRDLTRYRKRLTRSPRRPPCGPWRGDQLSDGLATACTQRSLRYAPAHARCRRLKFNFTTFVAARRLDG